MLWSIVQMMFKHPTLVQACLIGCLNSSTFTSYWVRISASENHLANRDMQFSGKGQHYFQSTNLTFILSSPPYNYNSPVIGLFAFIGIGAMTLGPPLLKANNRPLRPPPLSHPRWTHGPHLNLYRHLHRHLHCCRPDNPSIPPRSGSPD